MSSRKRRAAGSRKGPTPRRDTPEAAALREARHLLEPDGSRLVAQTWASMHLGSTWPTASSQDTRPEQQAVVDLVAEARRRPSPAAAAALAAARLVVPHPELDRALDDLAQPLPRWAAEPDPEPVRAWRAADPWGSWEAWFVDYGDHLLMASVAHVGGTRMQEVGVSGPAALAEYDDMLVRSGELRRPRVEVPVDAALRGVRAALHTTERAWPREPWDSYVEHRLLALARLGDADEPRPRPGEQRQRLFAALTGPDASEAERRAAELVVTYAYEHLHYPLRWSPEQALLFLLDWAPHHAPLDDEERRTLPGVLERWVVLALTEAGVEARWHEPVVEAVRQGTPAFLRLYDEGADGPARQLAAALADSGVDRDDAAAVQAVVDAWNAQRQARTAVLTGDVPAGTAVRLTVTLLDVVPPVWRRLVVPADVALDRLSRIVQAAMGWDGSYLHEWYAAGATYATPRRGVLDERTARLAGVLAGTDRLAYLYDLGDSWRHELVVDDVLLPGEAGPVPRVEAGARACPPEDIGGWPGYAQLVAGRRSELVEDAWFDPERFDLAVFDTYVRGF